MHGTLHLCINTNFLSPLPSTPFSGLRSSSCLKITSLLDLLRSLAKVCSYWPWNLVLAMVVAQGSRSAYCWKIRMKLYPTKITALICQVSTLALPGLFCALKQDEKMDFKKLPLWILLTCICTSADFPCSLFCVFCLIFVITGETRHGAFDSRRCGNEEIYGWAQVGVQFMVTLTPAWLYECMFSCIYPGSIFWNEVVYIQEWARKESQRNCI